MMENKMREEFEKAEAKYRKEWSDKSFPLTEEEKYAYKAGFEDGYQAGRNHPIEISLEEAAEAIRTLDLRYCPHTCGKQTPCEHCLLAEVQAKAVLSLVPNCVVKE